MKNKYKCQIVVPFFNDEDNFLEFIKRIDSIEQEDFSFILVDNGSHPVSLEQVVLNRKISKNKNWEVIRTNNNLGYGGGVMYGVKHISSNYVSWMPGNLKIDPIDYLNKLKKISFNEQVFIKFKRIHRQPLAKIKTLIFGFITTLIFRQVINDVGGVPCLVLTEKMKELKFYPENFLFDVFVYLHFKKIDTIKIKRPKISYTERLYGVSHWQTSWFSEIKLVNLLIKSTKIWKKYL